MTNILKVTAADAGTVFPLRGDMKVQLDGTPTKHFRVGFITRDAGLFPIEGLLHPIRALNASTQSQLTVGGKIGLEVTMMYDADNNEFAIAGNNLVSGDGGQGGTGGTGGTTGTLSFAVDSTVTGAAGTLAKVEDVGTPGNIRLKFTIPKGDAGANATGGTGTTGSGVPAGGTAGQVLTKTGAADYAVAWVTPAAGTGGTGGAANTSEVVVTADANGIIELNAAAGANFRYINNGPGKFANPVGFTGAAHIRLTIVVGATPGNTTWGTDYAFPNNLPPVLATQQGAINKVELDLTGGDTWVTDVTPPGTSAGGYGKITPIARADGREFYMLANAGGTGAFNVKPTGGTTTGGTRAANTIVILRSGKAAEATGTIADNQGGSYLLAGSPIASAGERRPLLQLLKTDYSEGPPRGANRPSFGKQVIGAEGGKTSEGIGMTLEVRDLRITGGRNDDGDCRGIGQNGQATLIVRNVDITDCNNGILTDNLTMTPLTIVDSLLDANGVGTPNGQANQGYNSTGYVHNIYTGHNGQTLTIQRSTISNSVTGHDVKSRCAVTIIEQTLLDGAIAGREIDLPNGGILRVKHCIIRKRASATQNNLVAIGNLFGVTNAPDQNGEVIDGTRPREYIFENCLFINEVDPAKDTSFLATKDPDVAVQFINCAWQGDGTLAKNSGGPLAAGDPNYIGMQMTNGVYHMPGRPPIVTVNGPTGPQLPVGRQSNVAMTPV